MNKKTERIEVLKQLIMTNKAASQEDLCAMLKAKGIITTQATPSRDLKDLKVSKSPDSVGGYKYSLPTYVDESAAFDHLSVSPVGIRSIEFSGQLAVIKTKPGYANMVGSIIDDKLKHDIMGTIAGDDTLLLILRMGTTSEDILSILSGLIPGIALKVIGQGNK